MFQNKDVPSGSTATFVDAIRQAESPGPNCNVPSAESPNYDGNFYAEPFQLLLAAPRNIMLKRLA